MKQTIPENARYIPYMDGNAWRVRDTDTGDLLLATGSERREMGFGMYEDAAAEANRRNVPGGYAEVPYRFGGGIPGQGNPNIFQSSHWDEPNVLAHIRFNDRIDADGKKVLYIEEIQSDWHQGGRKMGYGNKDGVPDAPFKSSWNMLSMKRMIRWAVENGYDRIAWTPGDIQAERYTSALQEVADTLEYNLDTNNLVAYKDGYEVTSYTAKPNEVEDYVGKEIAEKLLDPNYVQDVKPEYIFREWIDNANEAYYKSPSTDENIANDTGYTKRVKDAIQYIASKEQEFRNNETDLSSDQKWQDSWRILHDTGMDGQKVISNTEHIFDLNEIHDIEIPQTPPNTTRVTGDEIKVGGSGMRGFYDKIMPADTNKLIKKYGAQVGETTIKTVTVDDPGRLRYEVLDERGDPYDAFETMEAAQQAIQDIGESGYTVRDAYTETEGNLAVHSFDITDDMRKMVQEGIPLYQRDLDIFSIANKYGIATATADGKPLNKQLLKTINKYSETKYKTLEDIPISEAVKALEARRIEKGEPPVKNVLYKEAISFDKDGAA